MLVLKSPSFQSFPLVVKRRSGKACNSRSPVKPNRTRDNKDNDPKQSSPAVEVSSPKSSRSRRNPMSALKSFRSRDNKDKNPKPSTPTEVSAPKPSGSRPTRNEEKKPKPSAPTEVSAPKPSEDMNHKPTSPTEEVSTPKPSEEKNSKQPAPTEVSAPKPSEEKNPKPPAPTEEVCTPKPSVGRPRRNEDMNPEPSAPTEVSAPKPSEDKNPKPSAPTEEVSTPKPSEDKNPKPSAPTEEVSTPKPSENGPRRHSMSAVKTFVTAYNQGSATVEVSTPKPSARPRRLGTKRPVKSHSVPENEHIDPPKPTPSGRRRPTVMRSSSTSAINSPVATKKNEGNDAVPSTPTEEKMSTPRPTGRRRPTVTKLPTKSSSTSAIKSPVAPENGDNGGVPSTPTEEKMSTPRPTGRRRPTVTKLPTKSSSTSAIKPPVAPENGDNDDVPSTPTEEKMSTPRPTGRRRPTVTKLPTKSGSTSAIKPPSTPRSSFASPLSGRPMSVAYLKAPITPGSFVSPITPGSFGSATPSDSSKSSGWRARPTDNKDDAAKPTFPSLEIPASITSPPTQSNQGGMSPRRHSMGALKSFRKPEDNEDSAALKVSTPKTSSRRRRPGTKKPVKSHSLDNDDLPSTSTEENMSTPTRITGRRRPTVTKRPAKSSSTSAIEAPSTPRSSFVSPEGSRPIRSNSAAFLKAPMTPKSFASPMPSASSTSSGWRERLKLRNKVAKEMSLKGLPVVADSEYGSNSFNKVKDKADKLFGGSKASIEYTDDNDDTARALFKSASHQDLKEEDSNSESISKKIESKSYLQFSVKKNKSSLHIHKSTMKVSNKDSNGITCLWTFNTGDDEEDIDMWEKQLVSSSGSKALIEYIPNEDDVARSCYEKTPSGKKPSRLSGYNFAAMLLEQQEGSMPLTLSNHPSPSAEDDEVVHERDSSSESESESEDEDDSICGSRGYIEYTGEDDIARSVYSKHDASSPSRRRKPRRKSEDEDDSICGSKGYIEYTGEDDIARSVYSKHDASSPSRRRKPRRMSGYNFAAMLMDEDEGSVSLRDRNQSSPRVPVGQEGSMRLRDPDDFEAMLLEAEGSVSLRDPEDDEEDAVSGKSKIFIEYTDEDDIARSVYNSKTTPANDDVESPSQRERRQRSVRRMSGYNFSAMLMEDDVFDA